MSSSASIAYSESGKFARIHIDLPDDFDDSNCSEVYKLLDELELTGAHKLLAKIALQPKENWADRLCEVFPRDITTEEIQQHRSIVVFTLFNRKGKEEEVKVIAEYLSRFFQEVIFCNNPSNNDNCNGADWSYTVAAAYDNYRPVGASVHEQDICGKGKLCEESYCPGTVVFFTTVNEIKENRNCFFGCSNLKCQFILPGEAESPKVAEWGVRLIILSEQDCLEGVLRLYSDYDSDYKNKWSLLILRVGK